MLPPACLAQHATAFASRPAVSFGNGCQPVPQGFSLESDDAELANKGARIRSSRFLHCNWAQPCPQRWLQFLRQRELDNSIYINIGHRLTRAVAAATSIGSSAIAVSSRVSVSSVSYSCPGRASEVIASALLL